MIYALIVKVNWRMRKMKNKNRKKQKRTERVPKPLPNRKASMSRLPVLRFSPVAWAKLLYFRDKADTEVGGFGIAEPGDLLYVSEFAAVKQRVTSISVSFDDNSVADFFDSQVDAGRKPEQFARIWLHSHPGDLAEPSLTDEETFERVFGNCQWAVMFIVDRDGGTYARLDFNVGPGGQVLIPVEVDYSRDFGPSDRQLWEAEYKANVTVDKCLFGTGSEGKEADSTGKDFGRYSLQSDLITELESMEPAERRFVLDELAGRPDLWDGEESEAMFI
jgi:proteasome lid subunit RPN8/RPN11